MRICLVSQEYPPETARGGIGTQTWNKARALARLGHTVHVLSSAARVGPDLTTQIDEGVIVHRMQPPDHEFTIYNPPTFWLGYTWSVLRHLQGLMQVTAYDVIDFAEYGAEGFAYQLDRTPWNWAPVVVQLHGPLAMFAERIGWPERDTDFYRVGTFMEGVSITQADALMACSGNIADFSARFYGVPRESIDVVHCGVDSEAFRPLEEESPEPRSSVLFVGNIARNKGVDTSFEAVLRLRSKYPDIRLQILGKGDDHLTEELQSRAAREGARANVEFHGFIGERARLAEFYRRAEVFCSPADHEVGVANVYIEAMACGCPVVASTTGGAPEAVVDGETGVLVPPGDVEGTAAALDRILGDSALRRRMGEAGRQRVEEYFAMDKFILRAFATYQKAIERSRERLQRLKSKARMNALETTENSETCRR